MSYTFKPEELPESAHSIIRKTSESTKYSEKLSITLKATPQSCLVVDIHYPANPQDVVNVSSACVRRLDQKEQDKIFRWIGTQIWDNGMKFFPDLDVKEVYQVVRVTMVIPPTDELTHGYPMNYFIVPAAKEADVSIKADQPGP
jgi:hypothetical protein